jgi:formylglycine-generating enzyme required for sulfatase activity
LKFGNFKQVALENSMSCPMQAIWSFTFCLLAAGSHPAVAEQTVAPKAANEGKTGLQPGRLFRDCEECPEMVVIPAGSFTIGSPPDEPGRQVDEGPQVKLSIDGPFAAGRYEVTRRQYEAFLRDTNHPVAGNCMTDRRKPGTWALDPETNIRDPGFVQAGDHPAACVSWNDAKAYVAWLNAKAGGGYRLLAEAEWEYLARAGTQTAYPWGPDIDRGCPHMNGYDRVILAKKGNLYKGEAVPFANCSDGYLNTSPVGAFAPNAFGVYDMIGNLAEWVEDCSTASYAALQPDARHADGDCAKRMVRGGSWGTQPRQVRAAERLRYKPTDVDDSVGIRVAKDIRD